MLATSAWTFSRSYYTATLRLSYCLVRGHLLPTTARGPSLAATRPATLCLSYCLVRGHLLATSAGTFSRSYWTAPCVSGSGIINYPLRDEPGLKTKKVNYHSSEYSSSTTHVRRGSWGNVCVTRCKCEHSREHSRVYVQQETSYLQQAVRVIQYWEGTPHLVLISVL